MTTVLQVSTTEATVAVLTTAILETSEMPTVAVETSAHLSAMLIPPAMAAGKPASLLGNPRKPSWPLSFLAASGEPT